MTILFTVGHGTATQEELVDRLTATGVAAVVDVRVAPGSRRHPHFARDSLALWLPATGIAYRWEKRLGGFRRLLPGSPDEALRNESFRAYAGHMRTAEFVDAIDLVLDESAELPTAVMCSETVWWRCHRRLVADFVTLARGQEVQHVMPPARLEPHRPTEGVRLAPGGTLVYDAGAMPLPPSG